MQPVLSGSFCSSVTLGFFTHVVKECLGVQDLWVTVIQCLAEVTGVLKVLPKRTNFPRISTTAREDTEETTPEAEDMVTVLPDTKTAQEADFNNSQRDRTTYLPTLRTVGGKATVGTHGQP